MKIIILIQVTTQSSLNVSGRVTEDMSCLLDLSSRDNLGTGITQSRKDNTKVHYRFESFISVQSVSFKAALKS